MVHQVANLPLPEKTDMELEEEVIEEETVEAAGLCSLPFSLPAQKVVPLAPIPHLFPDICMMHVQAYERLLHACVRLENGYA